MTSPGDIPIDPQETFGVCRRFEPGFHSGWLTLSGHYVLYASEGTFSLEVGDGVWLLPPQRAAWVAGGVPFRLSAKGAGVTNSVLFGQGTLDHLEVGFSSRVFAVSTLARELLLHVGQWGPGREHRDDEAAAEHFFQALAVLCHELAASADDFWLPTARSEELARAMAYGVEHMAERPSLADVAKAAHCSIRTLARRFVEETGMSWQQFSRRARMIRAMELLSTPDTKVIEVAFLVGYASQSAFHQAFRDFCGETPAGYRRRICPQ